MWFQIQTLIDLIYQDCIIYNYLLTLTFSLPIIGCLASGDLTLGFLFSFVYHHLYCNLPYLYITDFHRMLKDYYSSQEFGGGWYSAVRARQHCHLDCKNCVYFYLYFISSVHDSISTSHTRSILFLFSSYKHFIFGPRTWKPRDYLLFHNSRPCNNYQYCL